MTAPLPGKEIRDKDIRALLTRLVKEQGWTYHPPTMRLYPADRTQRSFNLHSTPSDVNTIRLLRSKLRQAGARI